MTGVLNVTGLVRFTTDDLNLIFQRKLIGISAFSNWNIAGVSENIYFQYMDVRIFIEQPLNTTEQFTLAASIPAGGLFEPFVNSVTLKGNNNQVSILPMPIKVCRIVINCQDLLSLGNDMAAFVTLFWETKKRE